MADLICRFPHGWAAGAEATGLAAMAVGVAVGPPADVQPTLPAIQATAKPAATRLPYPRPGTMPVVSARPAMITSRCLPPCSARRAAASIAVIQAAADPHRRSIAGLDCTAT